MVCVWLMDLIIYFEHFAKCLHLTQYKHKTMVLFAYFYFFYCIFMFEYNFAIKNENHCRKTSIAYNPFGIYFAQTATHSSRLQYTTAWNTQRFLSGLIWKTHRAKCVLFSLSLALCVCGSEWSRNGRKPPIACKRIKHLQSFAFAPFGICLLVVFFRAQTIPYSHFYPYISKE